MNFALCRAIVPIILFFALLLTFIVGWTTNGNTLFRKWGLLPLTLSNGWLHATTPSPPTSFSNPIEIVSLGNQTNLSVLGVNPGTPMLAAPSDIPHTPPPEVHQSAPSPPPGVPELPAQLPLPSSEPSLPMESEMKSPSQTNTSRPLVYVALSATFGEQYAFYLPLTVLVWKEMGIGSVVFLVGGRWQTALGKFIVDTITEMGAIISYMPVPNSIPLTIVAQHARFYAPWLSSISPETVLITSDADIWPLNPTLYNLDVLQYDVRVLDAFAFSFFRIITKHEDGRHIRLFKTVHPSRENVSGYVIYPQFPITNIIMKARHWKQVLNASIEEGGLSAPAIWKVLTKFLGYEPSVVQASRRGPLWFSDQFFISSHIMNLAYAKQLKVQLVPRKTKLDRLGPKGIWCPAERPMSCRILQHANDSHNPRNPHLKGQHKCLMSILRCVLSPKAMAKADRIGQRYLALRKPAK